MGKTIRLAVTGAAGQIGYSLLFRLASGEVFGKETKVHLNLIELPGAMKAAEGTAMELDDCAFECLSGVDCFDSCTQGFENINWALMVGSKPRGPGMERQDLIKSNGPIFVSQGKALSRANSDVRIVVVGNPCNTNALIALNNSCDIPPDRFSAMTSLDENRAKAQLAKKACVDVSDISNVTIWGNHSTTMYPDFENVQIKGQALSSFIEDRNWLESEFISAVQKRGAEIISARGKSSAASAASSCIDHIKKISEPTAEGQSFSAAVFSDGKAYDIPEGIMCSFPLKVTANGSWELVENIDLSDFAKQKIKLSCDELLHERSLVQDIL